MEAVCQTLFGSAGEMQMENGSVELAVRSCGSAVFGPRRGSAASFHAVTQSNGAAACCLWHGLH